MEAPNHPLISSISQLKLPPLILPPLLLPWCRTWHHQKTFLGIRRPILKTVFPETLVVVTIRPITDATRMSSLCFPTSAPALLALKLYPNTNISDTEYYSNISDTNIWLFCTSLTSNGTDSSPFSNFYELLTEFLWNQVLFISSFLMNQKLKGVGLF